MRPTGMLWSAASLSLAGQLRTLSVSASASAVSASDVSARPLHFAMQTVRRHRLTWPRLCAHWRCRTPWPLQEAAPGGMGARLLP
jgi:hypothetical protein